jgi:hypothetical protein
MKTLITLLLLSTLIFGSECVNLMRSQVKYMNRVVTALDYNQNPNSVDIALLKRYTTLLLSDCKGKIRSDAYENSKAIMVTVLSMENALK